MVKFDHLGGDHPVLMIVCISPNQVYLEETLNSISYAEKAKKIKPITLRQNVIVTPEEIFKRRIMELEKENSNLRKLLLEKVSEGLDKYSNSQKQATKFPEKFHQKKPLYSLASLREDIESISLTASKITKTENDIKNLQKIISENHEAMEDLRQVVVSEKNETQLASLYRELRTVSDCLEDSLRDQEALTHEEKKLRDQLRNTKIKVLDNYQSLMQYCDLMDSSHSNFDNRTPTKISESKTGGCSWKEIQEIDEVNTDISWMKEELIKKEEQINELTKALKHLAKIPSSPQLGGLSRVGLDNMLADISSIRYDPKLTLVMSDCMEIEKKASSTNSQLPPRHLPDIIAKISSALDPTNKPSEENLIKREEDEYRATTERGYSRIKLERMFSHPVLAKQEEIDDYYLGGSIDQIGRMAYRDNSQNESELDDSNINPLSLADESIS